MLRFAGRRLALLAGALLVSSFVVYAALHVAPGNPLAVLSGGRTLSPEALATLEARYRLDQPFLVQYADWLAGVVRGDLGSSIALRQPVADVVADRIATTVWLVVLAGLIIVVAGVAAGVLAGLRPGWVDTGTLVVTTILAAVPSFVAAIVLVSVFSVSLGWLPSVGAGAGFLGRLEHLALPAVALAASSIAVVARVTRVSVRAELEREHVQTAVSRGLPWKQVVRRHVLRNAAIPITTIAGLTVTSLIALSAVVERAFALNGLGDILVRSALSKDFAVVQAIALILVAAFVIANAVIDLLYAVLDPRVALGGRAE